MNIEDDLLWLYTEPFSCSIGLNDDRPSFVSVSQMVADGEIEDEDWTNAEAKARSMVSNFLVSVQVYPCGSVSFYTIYSDDLADALRVAREHAARDLDAWAKRGDLPMHRRPPLNSGSQSA